MLFPGHRPRRTGSLRDYQHFINMRVWPRSWEGVTLLRGMEADVRTLEGAALRPGTSRSRRTSRAGPCGASPRSTIAPQPAATTSSRASTTRASPTARSLAQTTEMYLGALARSPRCWCSATRGGRACPSTCGRSWARRRASGKLIEINEHSLDTRGREGRTWASCAEIARACAELGCQIAVNTDAHVCCDVGRFSLGALHARGDRLPAGARGHPLRGGVPRRHARGGPLEAPGL